MPLQRKSSRARRFVSSLLILRFVVAHHFRSSPLGADNSCGCRNSLRPFLAFPTSSHSISKQRYARLSSYLSMSTNWRCDRQQIDRSQSDYSLTFHHILRDGTTPLVHYGEFPLRSARCSQSVVVLTKFEESGLELAKIAKLPSPMIDKAHIVSSTLDTLVENRRLDSSTYQLSRRKRELLSVSQSLLVIRLRTELTSVFDFNSSKQVSETLPNHELSMDQYYSRCSKIYRKIRSRCLAKQV